MLAVCDLEYSLFSENQDSQVGTGLGRSVAITPDYYAAGAPDTDDQGVEDLGMVRVYDTETHEVLWEITNPDSSSEYFGTKVSIAGDYLAVGSHSQTTVPLNPVVLYDLSSANPTEPFFTFDQPAFSVELSSEYLAFTDRDHVYVFDLQRFDFSEPLFVLNDPTPSVHEIFGGAMKFSGDLLFLGQSSDSVNENSEGSVHVFDLSADDPNDSVFTFTSSRPQDQAAFGAALDTWGNLLIVGDPGYNTRYSDGGAAYVYEIDNLAAGPITTYTNSSPRAQFERFGASVAISEFVTAIGTPNYATSSSVPDYVGRVSVYRAGYTGAIVITGDRTADSVGYSVDVLDRLILFGAPGGNVSEGVTPAVHLYESRPDGFVINVAEHYEQWTRSRDAFGQAVTVWDNYAAASTSETTAFREHVNVYDLSAADPTASIATLWSPADRDSFGAAIVGNGDLVFVGSDYDPDLSTSGAVYVYDVTSGDSSTPLYAIYHPTGGSSLNRFGGTLAIGGDLLAVAAYDDRVDGESQAGRVFLYNLSAADPTVPIAEIENPSEYKSNDHFGHAMVIEGNRLIIGAYGDQMFYVYDLSSDLSVPTLVVRNPFPSRNDYFGYSLAVDGDDLLVGAPNDWTISRESGAVFWYDLSSATPEVPIATIGLAELARFYKFGTAVAFTDEHLVISATLDNTQEYRAGAVYLYDRNATDFTRPLSALFDPIGSSEGSFGISLATKNELIFVGSPGSDVENFDQGAVHVFSTDNLGSHVSGQHLFYNNSTFDGFAAVASADDDNAIAVDKVPLFPDSGPATFANYTSYVRGIHGIMIDLHNAALPDVITWQDFDFRMGTDGSPDDWRLVRFTSNVTARPIEECGSRITVIWDDTPVQNTWLRVRVRANTRTGLAEEHVFFVGNLIGDVTGDGMVNGTDFAAVRANQTNFLNPASIDNLFDLNRDGRVNATDLLIVRDHTTTVSGGLPMISPTSGNTLSKRSDTVAKSDDRVGFLDAVRDEADTAIDNETIDERQSQPSADTGLSDHDAALLAILSTESSGNPASVGLSSAEKDLPELLVNGDGITQHIELR